MGAYMIRRWFNRITNAAILYVGSNQLVLCLADGIEIESHTLEDLVSLKKQPILLVINPIQFLQVHHQLRHLYLTTWQHEILHQLLVSSCVIRSIIFLPNLLERKGESEFSRILDFSDQKYIEASHENLIFWKQLQTNDYLQQMCEVSLFLRRYQVSFKEVEEPKSIVISQLNYIDLTTAVLHKPTHSLQSEGFPLVEKLMLKRQHSRRYMRIIIACLVLSGGSIMGGLFFLALGTQIFLNHNPWKLRQPVQVLPMAQRSKLLQFKKFLNFYPKSPLFSSQSLQMLFQQFPGKIVATDLIWEKKWTMSFIVNPAFITQIPNIKEWIGQHLKNSHLSESESTIHQYTLQFE